VVVGRISGGFWWFSGGAPPMGAACVVVSQMHQTHTQYTLGPEIHTGTRNSYLAQLRPVIQRFEHLLTVG